MRPEFRTDIELVKAEKFTAKLLVRMTPSLKGRLAKVAGGSDEGMNEIVRRGVEKEIALMEADRAANIARLQQLEALAKAHGSDVDATIAEMLKQVTEPELPQLAGATR